MNSDMGIVLAIVASSVIGILMLSDPIETAKLLLATATFMGLLVGVTLFEEYVKSKHEE